MPASPVVIWQVVRVYGAHTGKEVGREPFQRLFPETHEAFPVKASRVSFKPVAVIRLYAGQGLLFPCYPQKPALAGHDPRERDRAGPGAHAVDEELRLHGTLRQPVFRFGASGLVVDYQLAAAIELVYPVHPALYDEAPYLKLLFKLDCLYPEAHSPFKLKLCPVNEESRNPLTFNLYQTLLTL